MNFYYREALCDTLLLLQEPSTNFVCDSRFNFVSLGWLRKSQQSDLEYEIQEHYPGTKTFREPCHALWSSRGDLSETTVYLEPHFKLQRSLSRKLNLTSVVAYFPNSIWCIRFIQYSFKSWQTLQESEGTYNPSAHRWSNWCSNILTEVYYYDSKLQTLLNLGYLKEGN